MKVTLQGLESTDLSQRGQTFVYLAGENELLVEAFSAEGSAVGRFQIPSGGQVTLPTSFVELKIQNMGSTECNAEFLLIEGEYQRLSDVSLIQVQGITNAITTNVATMPDVRVSELPAVKVSELPAVKVSELPAVKVSELPAVEVSAMPEVVQKDVSSVLTTSFMAGINSVVSIPARTGRKRLFIQAYTESLDTTFCRLSDTSKTSITGQIMACGGGLLAELEHFHSAGLKFWNPSENDEVEVIIKEEF